MFANPESPFTKTRLFTFIAFLVTSVTVADAVDLLRNSLFIIGDDMGYSDVGFNGCKDIPTPRGELGGRIGDTPLCAGELRTLHFNHSNRIEDAPL
ncbi:MAG TPA: hypothetical protein VM260_16715 [Pirellula sp.]|nr:hypothetical protein [Pirellula sp.]